MPERTPKSVWNSTLAAMGNTIGQRVVTGLTLAILTFMVATGKGMIRNVYAQETKSIMKPEIDSLRARIEANEASITKTAQAVESMQAAQLEMYSAQLQRDTVLQNILEARAADRRKADSARANTAKLFDDLTGGKQ